MRTRIIIAALLIIFSLLISLFSFFYVQSVAQQLESSLKTAVEKNINGLEISEEINFSVAMWKKHRKVFGSFLKHSDAEELDKCFARVEIFSSSDSEELEEALVQCLVSLQSTINGEKLTIDNIF